VSEENINEKIFWSYIDFETLAIIQALHRLKIKVYEKFVRGEVDKPLADMVLGKIKEAINSLSEVRRHIELRAGV